jgi:hypothetical protein
MTAAYRAFGVSTTGPILAGIESNLTDFRRHLVCRSLKRQQLGIVAVAVADPDSAARSVARARVSCV